MFPASLLLTDNVGVPTPGNYTYEVVRADLNQPAVSLGRIVVQVQGGNATTGHTVPPTTVVANMRRSRLILGRFFSQVVRCPRPPARRPGAQPQSPTSSSRSRRYCPETRSL